MGKHSLWRKIAKRERRRRIRKRNAIERDSHSGLSVEEFVTWQKEQDSLEQLEYEQIEKTNMEENEKWVKAEKAAQLTWQRLMEQKERLRLQQLELEVKQTLEWEQEKEKKRQEEERLKEIEEENQRKQSEFMSELEQFLAGDSSEPPPALLVSRQTRPDCDPCPFFSKTACCRFGDQCSRNHTYPGISKVLLATNFYAHFGLDNASYTEYDTDVMLEYEDSDTYREFKEFFHDVVPEFEKFGRILQFKVCNNLEKHLRGNTFVEFAELRCAVAAYRALHTRWYGGKQLSLQFCLINSWKNAICGLQSRKRCPKGRACNFLHVFRNPNNSYNSYHSDTGAQESERSQRSTWRWSESPEVEVLRDRYPRSWDRWRSRDRKRARSRSRDRPRARSRSRDRPRVRSRSRDRPKARSRSRDKPRTRSTSRDKTRRRRLSSRHRRNRSSRSRSREKRSRSRDHSKRKKREDPTNVNEKENIQNSQPHCKNSEISPKT